MSNLFGIGDAHPGLVLSQTCGEVFCLNRPIRLKQILHGPDGDSPLRNCNSSRGLESLKSEHISLEQNDEVEKRAAGSSSQHQGSLAGPTGRKNPPKRAPSPFLRDEATAGRETYRLVVEPEARRYSCLGDRPGKPGGPIRPHRTASTTVPSVRPTWRAMSWIARVGTAKGLRRLGGGVGDGQDSNHRAGACKMFFVCPCVTPCVIV